MCVCPPLSVCLSMMHWSLCICVCLSVCVYLSISDLFVCARSVYVYVCLYVYIYLSICYMWWSVYDLSFYHVILFSACTSASLEPSYVLRAIGADEDLAHSSIRLEICPYNYNLLTDSLSLSLSLCLFVRFGIGRFTTEEEIDYTVKKCVEKVQILREMRYVVIVTITWINILLFHYSPLWEMVQEGIDLKTIQWTQHWDSYWDSY